MIGFGQVDTLFTMDGEKLLINVSEISEASIKYSYPNETFANTIPKSTVLKIHFKSGRIQEFSSTLNIAVTKSCLDWKSVQISNIESEVLGLQKIDVIGSKAKGVTTFSSISKLQNRAFNKIKMITAMLGGNVAYIMEQNTEEAVSGGKYGSTKKPSVTISGLAYTTKKVFRQEIAFGDYQISKAYVLKTNAYEVSEFLVEKNTVSNQESDLIEKNGFQKIRLNIASTPNIIEYTIIYAADDEVTLSGVSTSQRGKTTYYNLILKKQE